MRIAFIGHAFHQKTGSSRFLLDLLEQIATVDTWFGEPGTSAWGVGFDENQYDVIVIWQLREAFDRLSGHHPNVVFVPMYDAMFWAGNFYWRPAFAQAKILCFCWALRREVAGRGAVNAGFQYYPDPTHHTPVDDFDLLRGLLWHRRRDITARTAFDLCRGTRFDQFLIHDAPDPGHEPDSLTPVPATIARVIRTGWSADRAAYAEALRTSNVFFAPRPAEGIGMSLLEAMACGHCVVAPDAPTMNEYVSNGTNGLLYVPGRTRQLDFAGARSIGGRARESVERGHQRWLASIPHLLEFVTKPTAEFRASPTACFQADRGDTANLTTGPSGRPLVSVIVADNGLQSELEATLGSIREQVGCEFESIVIDRGSIGSVSGNLDLMVDQVMNCGDQAIGAPGTAMNSAVNVARGDWILFLRPSDIFAGSDALARMVTRVPAECDVIYGHHIDRHDDGAEDLHRAAAFETTWQRLQSGDLWLDWLSGIPARSAIAIRRTLLVRKQFNPSYRFAVEHELLFRFCSQGAGLFNCDEIVTIEQNRGHDTLPAPSARSEWRRIATTYGNAPAAARFFDDLPAMTAITPGPVDRFTRIGALALDMLARLDRFSPAVGRIARRTIESQITFRAVQRLRDRRVSGTTGREAQVSSRGSSLADREDTVVGSASPGVPRSAEVRPKGDTPFADAPSFGRPAVQRFP